MGQMNRLSHLFVNQVIFVMSCKNHSLFCVCQQLIRLKCCKWNSKIWVFCLQAAWGMFASTDVIYHWTVNHEMGFPRSAHRDSLLGVHLTPARGTSVALPSFVLTCGECMNAGESPVPAASSRFTPTWNIITHFATWHANTTMETNPSVPLAGGHCFNTIKTCFKRM